MKFSELDRKRIALWGFGRETRTLTRELAWRFPRASIVFAIDESRNDITTHAELHARGIDVFEPGDAENLLPGVDVLVRSPGVSIYKPLIRAALARGIAVTTPTGLWLAERGGTHVLGVTGTKGKSTTATVIAHLLSQTTSVELAGNIGRPVIELLDADPSSWVVCELSSYQIADLDTGPEVAVLTNLSREHTDWHGSEAQYRADKLRLFGLPGVRARVDLWGAGGERTTPLAPGLAERRLRPGAPAGAWSVDVDGNVLSGGEVVLRLDQIPLRGRHNARNVATALAAIEAAGLDRPQLPDALTGLEPLPHRLQTAHVSADATEWVDDSISTTPESAIAALDALADRHVVLIAGGQDRGQELSGLASALAARETLLGLILLPDTGAALGVAARAAGLAATRIARAQDLREAVSLANRHAEPGCVVLLSPAAPSYNAYRNFEERGEDFAALAHAVGLDA